MTDPTVDKDVIFASDPRATRTTAPRRPSPRSTSRTRSARPTGWRSSPACASTASSSTSTTCAPASDRLQPQGRAVVAAPRPDPQADATICRSTPATAAPICRSRATSSAASTSTTVGAEARAVRQLRDRREVGADRRPARDRGGLPARPHQHARDRPADAADRPDRRAAQQGHRARAGAEHQRPLAGLGGLCAGRRRRSPRPPRLRRRAATCRWSRATASRCGTATTCRTHSASASA